jgi:hypothetical protein
LAANWFREPGLLTASTAPVLVTVAFGWVVARGLRFLVGNSETAGDGGGFARFRVVPVCGRLPLAAAVGTDCAAAAMGWVGFADGLSLAVVSIIAIVLRLLADPDPMSVTNS